MNLVVPLTLAMTTKPGAVGANVAKFCRDTARLSVLDNDKKQTSVLRAVAGWHEKQVGALLFQWTSLSPVVFNNGPI